MPWPYMLLSPDECAMYPSGRQQLSRNSVPFWTVLENSPSPGRFPADMYAINTYAVMAAWWLFVREVQYPVGDCLAARYRSAPLITDSVAASTTTSSSELSTAAAGFC